MSIVERALAKSQAIQPKTEKAADSIVKGVANSAMPDELSKPESAPARTLETLLASRVAERGLVHLDRDRLTEGRMATPPSGESGNDYAPPSIKEDLRRLKRAVLKQAATEIAALPSQRVLMVTSALPGEGKTFTSASLALEIAAEADTPVLLVDGDVLRPKLTGLFGLEQECGLLDYLQDGTTNLDSIIFPTDIPQLTIIPAGRGREGVHELMAGPRLPHLTEELAGLWSRGIVLFDSSPALLSSEPHILAGLVGQVLFVVRAGVTEQRAVIEGIGSLGENRPVSLVLNCYLRPKIEYGYSSYYTY